MRRAVVLGCGVAGMAAAAALAGGFSEVVVIERDSLPIGSEARRGVPQGDQLHNLLTLAQRHLEELLPGFRASLLSAGCGDASVADETHVYELGVRMPERPLGLRLMCAWRPSIESVALGIIRSNPAVTIRDETKAVGVVLSSDGDIAGVRIEEDRGTSTLDTSLVVDAMGTGSQALRWLTEAGHPPPHLDELEVRQWYVSTVFRRPPRFVGVPDFWMSFPNATSTRGALVCPTGGGTWCVSVSGRAPDVPPTTAREVGSHVASLADPAIDRLLADAEPEGVPHVFRRHSSFWRRYDKQDAPVPGYLPIGDAVATLNPIFGQGISVASCQAAALAELVRTHHPEPERSIPSLTRAYNLAAANACRTAWALGQLVDRAAPGRTAANKQEELASWIERDASAHRRYVEMWHLISPADEFAPFFGAVSADVEDR